MQNLKGTTNWALWYTNGSGLFVPLPFAATGYLRSNGISAAPSWVATVSSGVSGTAHRLLYFDASGNLAELAYGSIGQMLKFNGATSVPSASNIAGIAGTANRILYVNNSGVVAEVALGAANTYLRSTGTTSPPDFADPTQVLYSIVDYVWMPDAGFGEIVIAGNQQGFVLHSGPGAETATKLFIDAETAPGASGLPITVEYGNTDDLDTVASWTAIASLTLSSSKSQNTTTMTNASIPANSLLRMNVGTVVGSPKDVTVTLRVKRPAST